MINLFLIITYRCRTLEQRCRPHLQTPEYMNIQVAIAQGFHLFPFRTEKLSLVTPMVLRLWESR